MKRNYMTREIPVLSTPITSANRRNNNNNPVVNLGTCTSFQLLEGAEIGDAGSVCFIGDCARGIDIAKALIRRSQKPFLFLGTKADEHSCFSSLEPEWIRYSSQESLPAGNGAIYYSKPFQEYADICNNIEEWSQSHIIVLHLGNGLRAGTELLNHFGALGQCLVFCESVQQSINLDSTRAFSAKEFMSQMEYLCVFSSGLETKELIELLPTYQYETITNTTGVNTFRSRSFFHPLIGHRGHGVTVSQSRTTDFKKSVFERDDLNKIYDAGYLLVYNALKDTAYLTTLYK